MIKRGGCKKSSILGQFRKPRFQTKAQDLSLTTIIIGILVLVVLVVLIFIFTGQTGKFGEGVEMRKSCPIGKCQETIKCKEGELPVPMNCDAGDADLEYCCVESGK